MSNTTKTTNELVPAISLRGLVVFPAMVLHFDIGRERSVNAVKAAAEGNGRIFLVAQQRCASYLLLRTAPQECLWRVSHAQSA